MKTSNYLLMLGGIAMLGALSSCGKGQQQQQMPAPEVDVIAVEETSADNEVSYPATIQGKTDIAIRPQVSGTILKVCVDEGEHVSKGQLLFQLDPVTFQAAVDQARSAVSAAKTAVSNAQITEQNQRRLYDKQIISEYEWQLSKNQLDQARAQLAQSQAALTAAQKNLSYTRVISPSAGVVGQIPFREGSLASPSSQVPLTTVSDNSQVYAYFSFDESELLNLTQNGTVSLAQAIAQMPPVQLRLANGSIYPLEGKVVTVSGVNDLQTGSSSVRALFDNPNGLLRSGSTGSVIMPVHSENVIVIPQNATYEIQNLRYALVLNDSNKTVPAKIEVLEVSDGKSFVVTEGLKAGDRVVIEGVNSSVRPNMEVKPRTPGQNQAQQAEQAGAEAGAQANK